MPPIEFEANLFLQSINLFEPLLTRVHAQVDAAITFDMKLPDCLAVIALGQKQMRPAKNKVCQTQAHRVIDGVQEPQDHKTAHLPTSLQRTNFWQIAQQNIERFHAMTFTQVGPRPFLLMEKSLAQRLSAISFAASSSAGVTRGLSGCKSLIF